MELNITRTARAAVSLSVVPSGEAPTTSLLDWPLTVKEEDYLSAAELCSADGSETRPHTSRPHTSRPHTSRHDAIPRPAKRRVAKQRQARRTDTTQHKTKRTGTQRHN